MRIISGKARGTKIQTIESETTRPTLDRVKESLFNIIQNKIQGTNVLDLFSGSGALGIESLSRGANLAIFCDCNSEATKVIKQNLTKTKLQDKAIIYNEDYKKCIIDLKKKKLKFDVIFLDPPYKLDLAIDSLKLIIENDLLNENAIIIIETDQKDRDKKEIQEIKDKYKVDIFDERKYGRANLIFVRKIEEN